MPISLGFIHLFYLRYQGLMILSPPWLQSALWPDCGVCVLDGHVHYPHVGGQELRQGVHPRPGQPVERVAHRPLVWVHLVSDPAIADGVHALRRGTFLVDLWVTMIMRFG